MNMRSAVGHMPANTNFLDRVGAFFGALSRGVADLSRRRSVVLELRQLSEHELADIGLTRGDIGRVFDPGYMAEHYAERAADRARSTWNTAI